VWLALCILDVLESRRGARTYVKSAARLDSKWAAQLNRAGGSTFVGNLNAGKP